MSYDVSETEDGAVITVTNVKNDTMESVSGTMLFFKDGEIVDTDNKIFANDDLKFKANSSISEQFSTLFEFDDIEFYLEGYYINGN